MSVRSMGDRCTSEVTEDVVMSQLNSGCIVLIVVSYFTLPCHVVLRHNVLCRVVSCYVSAHRKRVDNKLNGDQGLWCRLLHGQYGSRIQLRGMNVESSNLDLALEMANKE